MWKRILNYKLYMKNIIIITLLLSIQFFFGQEKVIKKPENVIILKNEIVSMDEVEKYNGKGYVKSMNKGVTEKVRNELFKKFGTKIGEKEFIFVVELFSEKEKRQNDKKIENTKETTEKTKSNAENILNVNDKATDFNLKLINGSTVKLSDLKGKVVLINFWATWCGPCLMEFYDIPKKIIEPFKESDFVFLAISRGENEKIVAKKVLKLQKNNLNFMFGIDPDLKIWNNYAIKTIPKNFLIDQNGIVRFVSTGNAEGNLDKIAEEIKKLLEK